jgi:hypothetical protein
VKAVWAKVRVDLRSSLGAGLAIVLVIGVSGGAAIGAAAAARRTQTAFRRFLAASRAYDLLVSPNRNSLPFDRAVARLPGVVSSGLIAGIELAGPVKPGEPPPDPSFTADASVDGRWLFAIGRPRVLAGRLPRPGSPTEVFLDPDAARLLHARVGTRLPMATVTSVPKGFPNAQLGPSNITYLTMTVTGIGVTEREVLPANYLDAQPTVMLTPAMFRTYAAPGGARVRAYDGVVLTLASVTDRAAFTRRIGQIARSMHVGPAFVQDRTQHEVHVRRTLFPQVMALWLFAGLLGAGLVLVIALILARRLSSGSLEHPILRTLGMTREQLMTASLLEVAVVAAGGCLLAAGVAAATSAATPFGVARAAEPHPGFAPNLAIIGVGTLGLLVLILAVTAIPAWRAASVRGGSLGVAALGGADRPSAIAERVATGALPASAAAGIRMALEPGRGRTAVPVRSGTIGLAIAIATLTAAVTFGTNLTRLVSTPPLYGWNWSAMVGSPFGFSSLSVGFLRAVPGVAEVAGGVHGSVTIRGAQIPAVGIDPDRGISPTLLRGRAPERADEIVLGARDLHRLGLTVGGTVAVTIGDTSTRMRVVGEAVFPSFEQGSFPATGLGDGALLTAHALAPAAGATSDQPYTFALVRYAAGADPATVRRAIVTAAAHDPACHPANTDPPCLLLAARLPEDISAYGGIRGTPFVLSGILAGLAFALMTYILLASVRRRRRDLAVLKTLGFLRRQVSATVAWQATTIAVIAGAIGLPLGVVAGRIAWMGFAAGVGVSPAVALPLTLLAVAIPAGIVLANLVGWVPGRIASRTPAAIVLRSE